MSETINIGFLIYPGVTQLDATGPAQVLSFIPNAKIHMVWKNTDPVMSDADFAILPTNNFDNCPNLDLICVPGGEGQRVLMEDAEVLGFLKKQGEQAKYVTSVCTGSLLLGAAGLLQGYKSACHWAFGDNLQLFGAEFIKNRVVRDRNRISGGGITAGIDFGLALVAELVDENFAKETELYLEYAPEPPFNVGSPEKAGSELIASLQKRISVN